MRGRPKIPRTARPRNGRAKRPAARIRPSSPTSSAGAPGGAIATCCAVDAASRTACRAVSKISCSWLMPPVSVSKISPGSPPPGIAA